MPPAHRPHEVDLGGLGDLAYRAERVRDGTAVGVQIPVPGILAGVAPGDHEYLISLRDEELEHAAAGRKVGDVVLVDHRRDHEQRELVHGGRGRLVLDELEDVGAGHHRSRRHREILADLERVGLHHRRDVRGGGHIGDQGTGAPDEAQAAGVDERLPCGRAEQRVVARRGCGDEIGQHELQALIVPPVQLGVSEQLLGGLPDGQVGLDRALEQRVLTPRGICEPAVAALPERSPNCPPRCRRVRRPACRPAGPRSPDGGPAGPRSATMLVSGRNRRSVPRAASGTNRSSAPAASSSPAASAPPGVKLC